MQIITPEDVREAKRNRHLANNTAPSIKLHSLMNYFIDLPPRIVRGLGLNHSTFTPSLDAGQPMSSSAR